MITARRLLFSSVCVLLSCCPLLSREATAMGLDEIVKRTNHTAYYQGRNGRARVAMTITDGQGRIRTREFTMLRLNTGQGADGDQKFYVYFHRPADVNKMVFMVWKHVQADDDRWLYLPALDLVKRIAATDERTAFVGSDFFYEDVSGRTIDEDRHELVDTTDTYYVLKNTPKDAGAVEFAFYKMWIHTKTFIPVKIEYYNAQGHKYREYQALAVETIEGFPTVTKATMSDQRSGGSTQIDYSNISYQFDIPEDVFSERYLRRVPKEYLY